MDTIRNFWKIFEPWTRGFTFIWVVASAMLDILGLFPKIDWRILFLVGFILFALLMQVHINRLETKLKPKLDLVYGDYDACQFHYESGTGFKPILFRVGVLNKSGKTIEDVQVYLEDLDPQGIEFGPIPMIFMHQQEYGKKPQLHPGDRPTLYCDVVDSIMSSGKLKARLQYAISSVPNIIDAGHYELTLLAEGKDVPSCRKKFWIDVDQTGALQFGESI